MLPIHLAIGVVEGIVTLYRYLFVLLDEGKIYLGNG